MSKRPSIIDDLELPPKRPAPAPSSNVVEIPTAAAVPAPPPARRRAPRPDVQHTSVYIPREAFERLREIAFTERCKIHDLIMQGLDLVIAERGHPERATRSVTALQRQDTTE
jgi:hypothetical protein